MTMVDLLNTPNLSDPQLSADGRRLVYVLAESDWADDRRVSHIWILEGHPLDYRVLPQMVFVDGRLVVNKTDGRSAVRESSPAAP
ncbi:MAG: hypothetical protein ACRD2N_14765 [Vicinamibacterales bacterium]